MSLWLLLSAHFIADFFLQPDSLAEKKTQNPLYLALHALIYAVVLAIVVFPCFSGDAAWRSFVTIAFSHFVIDFVRAGIDKKHKNRAAHLASFLADQVLHVSIICASVYIFDLNVQNRLWLSDLASTVPLEQILRYALIFIIILDPASVFVKKLSSYISDSSDSTSNNGQEHERSVGRVIGKLERIIIVILVICGEIGAIGFVLTAKSLARYKQLNKQDFAEKYLVGTLSSTAIAVIAALLLK